MTISVAGNKTKLVENRAHSVRTGSLVFYNPKTDYKRSKEKQAWRKQLDF